MTENKKIPVLIVGAGPTGLILALWLKKCGVNFRIIDKNNQPGLTSRALAVQARTLEFYQQLGIADQLIEAGIIVPEISMRRFGKVVAVAKLGAIGKEMSPYPYLLFCSQDIHEEILCKELQKMGVEVERETELMEFSQDESKVTAKIKSSHGAEIITADYLCGCDGAHSLVRHGLKEQFPGGSYSQVFFVADVQAEGEAAKDLQVTVSKKDFCIVMPIKQRASTRLTGLVPPESERKEKITFDDVKESVAMNTGLRVNAVNWFSSYHVHHRVAEAFQVGRVFLSGDAGHIHSPAGGQGMNTGIGDAINLAWKLSEVVHGRFSQKILESYAIERMAFARVLIQSTDTAFRFIASRSFLGSIFRAYLLPTVFANLAKIPAFVKFAFKTISQTRIQYRESPLSKNADNYFSRDVLAGDRLPWVRNANGDNYKTLKDLSWQVHIYGKASSAFKSQFKNYPIYEIEWNADAKDKGLLENALYFLRPDGHIAFISRNQDAKELQNYLKSISFLS